MMPLMALMLAAGEPIVSPTHSEAAIDGEWFVTAIGDKPVPPDAPVSIRFAGEKVTGQSGCNGYFGTVRRAGQHISFAALGGTKLACPQARMDVESRFLAAIGAAQRFEIGADGVLTLLTAGGERIVARKI